jgi:uncharacterized membrane protein
VKLFQPPSPHDVPRYVPWLHLIATMGLALWLLSVVLWFKLEHTPLRGPLDFLFDVYCHRMPERSLRFAGEPLPVCSRCTGVIVGYLIGGVLALCGAEKLWFWRIPWAIVLIGLMGLSWLAGFLGYFPESWHGERVFAGGLGGLGGYIFIACCVVYLLSWWQRRRLIASTPANSSHA